MFQEGAETRRGKRGMLREIKMLNRLTKLTRSPFQPKTVRMKEKIIVAIINYSQFNMFWYNCIMFQGWVITNVAVW